MEREELLRLSCAFESAFSRFVCDTRPPSAKDVTTLLEGARKSAESEFKSAVGRLVESTLASGRPLAMSHQQYLCVRGDFAERNALKFIKQVFISQADSDMDYSAFYGVPELHIYNRCRTLNIAQLGGHARLEIHGGRGVKDLTSVRRVPYLALYGTDVEELAEMENDTLIIVDGDRRLKSIARLSHVKNLTINQGHAGGYPCKPSGSLSGMGALANVSGSVSLRGIRVDDLSVLRAAEVSLTSCDGVTNLCALRDPRRVTITHCDGVADLTPLKHAREVSVEYCRGVVDLSPLKNVRVVSVANCPGVIDVSPLKTVSVVRITDCPGVIDVSPLRGVPNLTLTALQATGFSRLGGHRTLTLTACYERKRLDAAAWKACYRVHLNSVRVGRLLGLRGEYLEENAAAVGKVRHFRYAIGVSADDHADDHADD